MGRRGPKPEPAEIKIAKGNPGRRKIGSDPFLGDGASGKVVPPAWLKKDALTVWNRLAPRLVALKLLTPTDADTFGRYCRNFARWLAMQNRLDTKGEIYEIETASGIVRRSDPAFMISDRLERQLVSTEAVFGLNPAERQRIFAARANKTVSDGDLFSANVPAAVADRPAPRVSNQPQPIGFLQ